MEAIAARLDVEMVAVSEVGVVRYEGNQMTQEKKRP